VAYGSFDNFRASLNALGSAGSLGYNLDYSHFQVDGYREHSAAKNDSFNGKLNYSFNDSNRLAFIANVISRPDAQDPLGLTQAQFAADPESTDSAATRFNTRKSLQQQQGGLIYDRDISDSQSVRVLGYLGHRSVQQFLSIPSNTQLPATSAGGVVDLNRQYGGAMPADTFGPRRLSLLMHRRMQSGLGKLRSPDETAPWLHRTVIRFRRWAWNGSLAAGVQRHLATSDRESRSTCAIIVGSLSSVQVRARRSRCEVRFRSHSRAAV